MAALSAALHGRQGRIMRRVQPVMRASREPVVVVVVVTAVAVADDDAALLLRYLSLDL